MKKNIFLPAVIALALMLVPISSNASSADTPSKPLTYMTEVKVKLLPTSSFSFSINGTYQLVNLDSNTVVPLSNTITFAQVDGKVQLSSAIGTEFSVKGFQVNELTQSDGNYVEISKINSAYGLANVQYRGSFDIKPGSNGLFLLNRLDMENYLKGVVPSEMPSSWAMEALKAQAVAARSYAYMQMKNSKSGYLEMTIASQVYGGKSKEDARGNQAVKETATIYATYDNVPIHGFFHSSSGGYTENSEDVWTNEVPYIRAVEDKYDKNNGNYHYGWEFIGQASTIKQKLNLASHQKLVGLTVTKRGAGKGVMQMDAVVYNTTTEQKSTIALVPKYVATPDRFRSAFGISLKSNKFQVKSDSSVKIKMADGSEKTSSYLTGMNIQTANGTTTTIKDQNLPVRTLTASSLVPTTPNEFTFTGDGWGHSLGMSQWGARGMADAGFTYDKILKHYYTGIEVKKLAAN